MREIECPRRRKGEVQRLTVEQARAFLAATAAHAAGHAVDKQGRRAGGEGRTPDVHELAIFLPSTGCRIGEALAVIDNGRGDEPDEARVLRPVDDTVRGRGTNVRYDDGSEGIVRDSAYGDDSDATSTVIG